MIVGRNLAHARTRILVRGSMIEALSSAAEPRQTPAKDARSDNADAPFSLALAAAAIEARAGASLKAFGGAPEGAAAAIGDRARSRADMTRNPSPQADAERGAPPSDQPDAADAPGPIAKAPPGVAPAIHAGESRDAGPSQRAIPVFAGMSARGMNAAATLQTRVTEGVAAREASATRVTLEAMKAMRSAAPRPAPAQEEFAKLLARRLDSGGSHFDIRLNPPELGRVEARLIVGDDGKATMTLKFDNQAAFDLFARDEAALRAAIAGSGFQFGAGDLAFTLERRDAPAPAAPAPVAIAEPAHPQSVEPLSLSPFSHGVIDLRV
jgi:flagellar hook-length control protein FliK